jgi:hypothetical protein
MSLIKVNGVEIECPDGASVSVINGQVIINGVAAGEKSNNITIDLKGTLISLRADRGSVTCENVTGNVDAGGSVNCKDVGGSVDAGGSVDCGNVGGDVEAGGSVKCGEVHGDIEAGGSVRHG